ncbi:MAG: hypothetical protein KGJ80_10195 [Chloroflexota bacterium]|nr:hypothetical protein [Chloroflexota bacterium]
MTNPLVLHVASAVEDKQDALLNTWIIGWVGHALITDPLNLFNANIFYPYANTLAFSETMLPQGLFALPFNLAFDNTVLGYNLVLLASFFLAAYAMYLFIFDLTRSRGAAIVAGTIFAFNPYNLGNLAQVQLLSLGWLPLAMMFLRKVTSNWRLGNRDWRLEIRDSVLFAFFFSLQALSSFYFAFLAGIAVALYVVWFLISHFLASHSNLQSFDYAQDKPLISNLYLPLARLVLASAVIALLLVPFFLPYLQVQRDLGFQRKIEESEPFSASLKLYTEVSPQNVLYGNLLAPRPPVSVGGYPLDNLFPGIAAVALAIVGIAATRNRERWFYFSLLAFAFLLSLGPRLFLTPSVGTDITLPYRWLYDALPLMRAFRAPVRFDALVMFALAVLAGFGVQKAESTKQKAENVSGFLPTAYCLLLTGIIALEYLAVPAANITPAPTGDAIPPYVRWLAQQPQTTILELPMIASEPGKPLDLTAQYLSTYHWQRTPDGYSGFVPPKRGEIAYEMQSFPGERAISLLQALDVQYVIVHGIQPAAARAGDLQLIQQFDGDYVYHVAPRAPDASALSASVYLPYPAAPNAVYFAYLIVPNRTARSFAIKPTDELQVDAQWSDGTTQRVTTAMPLVTSSVSVVRMRLDAPPRAGTYRLELRVTSRATGQWDLSGNVEVKNEEPARQVVLPARIALSAPLKSVYAPGDAVDIDLTWLPLNKIDAYYSASVRVVDARGSKIIAQDRQPATPTLLWTPGVIVPDRFALTLPRDLAPGEYTVQVLMYQADQGIDALLLDEQFVPRLSITLGTFAVK